MQEIEITTAINFTHKSAVWTWLRTGGLYLFQIISVRAAQSTVGGYTFKNRLYA
jgi:hypothetical protein